MKSAEALFKQGKAEAALSQLHALAKSAGGDLPTLNRIGDLLARHGKAGDAVQYYLKIAAKFTEQGFYPKAVAIYKKVLRLESANTDCLIRLGELYVNQKLPGEAREYFEQAARALTVAGEFAQAREVYERVAEAEPGNLENRIRLAEARASEGESERAGEELLVVGESLLGFGKHAEAEKAFRRAEELLPERREPLLGVADVMAAAGRAEEALTLLESADEDPEGLILGARTLHFERAGRHDDAAAQLAKPGATEISNATFRRIFEYHLEAGSIDDAWSRYSVFFEGWSGTKGSVRTIALLTDLCDLEEPGHVPALQRLYDMLKAGNNRASIVQTLERLVAAYRARSMHDEASLMLDELKTLAPKSSTARKAAAGKTDAADSGSSERTAKPAEASQQPGGGAPHDGAEEDPLLLDAEAPAVPLNRGDEEFVTGRLTQAEILEKYGLQGQALDQVNEVVERFPGHEKAQKRLVALLRAEGDRDRLRKALVGLALAQRASGDGEGANRAAEEARQLGEMDEATAQLLGRLGLAPREDSQAESTAEPQAEPAIVPTAHHAGSSTAKRVPGTDGAVVIDFDAPEEDSDAEAEPAPSAEARPVAATSKRQRVPGNDMLKEIRGFLDSGKVADAAKAVKNLLALGYASSELDELADGVRQAAGEPEVAESAAAPAAPEIAEEGLSFSKEEVAAITGEAEEDFSFAELDEDDDLSTITAALESELFSEDESGATPAAAESEQSLGEVFKAFKEHVEQEVGDDDYRTHYNLGIAYKEMGLMDEALAEFELSVRSPELFREACAMLAMCHREREDIEKAVGWYRQALEADGAEETELSGLRYDLADVLLLSGDRDAALDMFRNVLQSDPSFRDVQDRVADLESRPAT